LKRSTFRTTFERTHFWKKGYLWAYFRKEAVRKRLLVLLTSVGVKKMFFFGFAHFLMLVFPTSFSFPFTFCGSPCFGTLLPHEERRQGEEFIDKFL
jgi:hypothetical protein